MFAAIRVALIGLLLSAAALCLYGCWALRQWGATGAAMTATAVDLDAAVKRLNGPTGPITEADKLLLALKSTTVHADMVLDHENRQLRIYDGYAARIAADIDGVSSSLRGAADAGRDSARGATAAIGSADHAIQETQSLVKSLNQAVQASTVTLDALNARITDPHVDALMLHLESTSGHIDGITSDSQVIVHRFEQNNCSWLARLVMPPSKCERR